MVKYRLLQSPQNTTNNALRATGEAEKHTSLCVPALRTFAIFSNCSHMVDEHHSDPLFLGGARFKWENFTIVLFLLPVDLI